MHQYHPKMLRQLISVCLIVSFTICQAAPGSAPGEPDEVLQKIKSVVSPILSDEDQFDGKISQDPQSDQDDSLSLPQLQGGNEDMNMRRNRGPWYGYTDRFYTGRPGSTRKNGRWFK